MFIVGMLVALSPCLPLIGILLEIALLSKGLFSGVIYSLFFGIGTMLSPLLLLGAVIPLVGGRIDAKRFKIFTCLCGIMLVLVGLYLIFRRAS
jgi:sulfite exporter TauE/SafE